MWQSDGPFGNYIPAEISLGSHEAQKLNLQPLFGHLWIQRDGEVLFIYHSSAVLLYSNIFNSLYLGSKCCRNLTKRQQPLLLHGHARAVRYAPFGHWVYAHAQLNNPVFGLEYIPVYSLFRFDIRFPMTLTKVLWHKLIDCVTAWCCDSSFEVDNKKVLGCESHHSPFVLFSVAEPSVAAF